MRPLPSLPSTSSTDARAREQKLTERIHTSLHSLRTDTTDQLQSAKEAVRRADDRVGYSTRTLRQANDTIRESAKAVRFSCFLGVRTRG